MHKIPYCRECVYFQGAGNCALPIGQNYSHVVSDYWCGYGLPFTRFAGKDIEMIQTRQLNRKEAPYGRREKMAAMYAARATTQKMLDDFCAVYEQSFKEGCAASFTENMAHYIADKTLSLRG